jgi:Protein of unknown function (DUF3253)
VADEEDPIRSFLRFTLGNGESYAPQKLAQDYYATRAKAGDPPEAWRKYLQAFKQQITSLAKAGEVEYLRKGKPVPLEEVKGVVRVRKKA